jgi:hypothetical protein
MMSPLRTESFRCETVTRRALLIVTMPSSFDRDCLFVPGAVPRLRDSMSAKTARVIHLIPEAFDVSQNGKRELPDVRRLHRGRSDRAITAASRPGISSEALKPLSLLLGFPPDIHRECESARTRRKGNDYFLVVSGWICNPKVTFADSLTRSGLDT